MNSLPDVVVYYIYHEYLDVRDLAKLLIVADCTRVKSLFKILSLIPPDTASSEVAPVLHGNDTLCLDLEWASQNAVLMDKCRISEKDLEGCRDPFFKVFCANLKGLVVVKSAEFCGCKLTEMRKK